MRLRGAVLRAVGAVVVVVAVWIGSAPSVLAQLKVADIHAGNVTRFHATYPNGQRGEFWRDSSLVDGKVIFADVWSSLTGLGGPTPSGLGFPKVSREGALLMLHSADGGVLVADFAARTLTATNPAGSEVLRSGSISDVSAQDCLVGAESGPRTCTCDLRTLRPLQGAVGLGEVAKKTKDVLEETDAEKKDLQADPIKVVRGPHGLYVTDHHHGALAWLKAGYAMGVCALQADYRHLDEGKFFATLVDRKLVRLKDEQGALIKYADLKPDLQGVPDDPYRTLAWLVRRADGYCRSLMTQPPPEFAEFLWADEFRKQRTLPLASVAAATAPTLWRLKKKERDAAQLKMITAARQFAMGQGGRGLPGFNGDAKRTGATCNP